MLALSELCETILRELALPNVQIIPLAVLEKTYPELAEIKLARKEVEYYFTLTPFLPLYLFSHTTFDRITYIDGDPYFVSSPRPTLDKLTEASVAITPHRFHVEYESFHALHGRFNVGNLQAKYRRAGLP